MHPELLTDHMIDIEPQDEAMDEFRKNFRLVACCFVSRDGKKMSYRLKTEDRANIWKINAGNTITSLNLPLIAEIKVKREKGKVVEVFLNIIYKPQ
jgi:hypothetical protein